MSETILLDELISGGTDKGKCEVSKEINCAWSPIVERMKELPEAEGIKIAIEQVKQVLDIPGFSGVPVMVIEWASALEPIVKAAGLCPRPAFADEQAPAASGWP